MKRKTPENPLKVHLQRRGQTPSAFARRLHIHKSTMSRLLSGQRVADADILAKIERETGGDVTPNAWIAWWDSFQGDERAA